MDGGNGDDVIRAQGAGIFSADGGNGNDTIEVVRGGQGRLSGGAGDDRITVVEDPAVPISDSFSRCYFIEGGGGNDTVSVGNAANVTVSLGDGDNVASVGEGVFVFSNGDGADVINIDITSDPSLFSDLGDVLTGFGGNGLNAIVVTQSGAGDSVNITVDDPGTGSFHYLRTVFDDSFEREPGSPSTLTFSNTLIWSADPAADLGGLVLADSFEQETGLHVIATFQTGTSAVDASGTVGPVTAPPAISINVVIASVSPVLASGLPFS